MKKTGFIYLWRDKKHNKYYIGSHLGSEDDGYICSSTWMRNARRARPQDFSRRVIERDIPKDQLVIRENRYLNMIKNDELGKKYYNLSRNTPNHFNCTGKGKFQKGQIPWNKNATQDMYSEEYRQMCSERQKGKPSGMKGKTHTDEANKKNSMAHLGPLPKTHKAKLSGKNRTAAQIAASKKHSERMKKNNPKAWLGKHRSEETKKKISEGLKGNNNRRASICLDLATL